MLTAECNCMCPPSNQEKDYEIEGKIYDEENDLVAIVKAKWKVSPKL